MIALASWTALLLNPGVSGLHRSSRDAGVFQGGAQDVGSRVQGVCVCMHRGAALPLLHACQSLHHAARQQETLLDTWPQAQGPVKEAPVSWKLLWSCPLLLATDVMMHGPSS